MLAEIEEGFPDSGFALSSVAGKLGLSLRYVQDLLQDTGMSFVPRVTELRLQKARPLLTDHRCDRMAVGDIADACGFSEVAYFNRCFRKRFRMSPTSLRSGNSVVVRGREIRLRTEGTNKFSRDRTG